MNTTKIYSLYSHFYDSFFGRIFQPGRRIANELMDVQPGEKILEVGVGTGISLPFYSKNAEVVGIDISQDMIKQAEKRKQELNLSNIRLNIMDATRMAFRDGFFDKAIAAHSITVIPEPVETLKEMKRVCKKDAEFFFLNYAGSDNDIITRFEKAISPIRNKLGLGKAIELEELLHSVSFEIVFNDRVNIFKLCQIIKCKALVHNGKI
ncbi:MAG: methyltransferase domain-containing protein [Candidatus Scalindua sediminis]|nr:methyltransferase domain-containing protein [Candidatus Scalindua sediminis]